MSRCRCYTSRVNNATVLEELRLSPFHVAVGSVAVLESPQPDATWVSEVVAGEPVRVLEERGDWASVVLPLQPSSLHSEGYPGWLRTEALVRSSAPPVWRTLAASCPAYAEDGTVAARLPLGSLLRRGSGAVRPGWLTVLLPNGDEGWVRDSEVADGPPEPGGRDAVLGGLGMWRTQPYIWGGTSSLSGADCSGLVYRLYGRAGYVLPRDAHDQFDLAPARHPGPLDGAQRGDLVFFRAPESPWIDHVGVYLGNGSYLSAYDSAAGISIHEVHRDHYVGWASYL